jgi:hypothetical protein
MKYFLVLPFALSLGTAVSVAAVAQTNGLGGPPGANGSAPTASSNAEAVPSTQGSPSATASRKARETDQGLSRNPDECAKHGCIGNNQ